MAGGVNIYDSEKNPQRKITIDDTTKRLEIQDALGNPFPFGSKITVTVSAGETSVIPKGTYYVICGANTKVEIYDGASWVEYIPAGGVGLVISNGSSVRFSNTGGADEDSYLIPLL